MATLRFDVDAAIFADMPLCHFRATPFRRRHIADTPPFFLRHYFSIRCRGFIFIAIAADIISAILIFAIIFAASPFSRFHFQLSFDFRH
jgi:hypothetical protein